jgi:hypothetical protein
VRKELKKLTKEIITSLTGWEFILDALSVAGFLEIGIRGHQLATEDLCPRFGLKLTTFLVNY